jgi:tRNA(Ile)-lysidine synthase
VPIPPPDPALVARFRRDLEALAGPEPGLLGVAVSGGPDSLALLLLAHATFAGQVRAATVDHRLRPESAAEAAFAAEICARLSVPHATLTGEAIAGNIQSGARALRYRLLAGWAEAEGVRWLLTAHHQDDQAETLLMRLQRGAGLAGLAGIRATASIAGAAIARPLLGWRRAELARIPAAAGLDPVDDPSNADDAYDRVRLRKHIARAEWLDVPALARSAAALAEAETALDWAAARLADERIRREGEAILLDPAGLPAELRRRLLLRIVGPAAPPRGADVQRLLARLEAGGGATLAGMKCEGGPLWRFTPAPPRRKR